MPDPDSLEPTLRQPIGSRPDSVGGLVLRALLMLTLTALTALSASPGQAQESWVMDKDVSLTLRTGAGTQYRIIGSLTTGDTATVLERGDSWTKVRIADGREGWIAAGFLQAKPPARIELERLERDAEELRSQVGELSEKATELRATNDEIESNDSKQRLTIDQLTRENYELRAGARWPEWITGAGIVLTGMVLGALLGRNAGRRRQPRVRL